MISEATGNMEWMNIALQYGPLGFICFWFLFRSEPRLRAIESSLDRQTRANIVTTIAIANALEALKWHSAAALRMQVEPILVELDDAKRIRDKDSDK